MRACGCRNRPGKAPAICMKQRQRPQVHRPPRHTPIRQLQQAHQVGTPVAGNHALRIRRGAGSVVKGDSIPFVGGPNAGEIRIPFRQERFVLHCSDYLTADRLNIGDVDYEWLAVKLLKRFRRQGGELSINKENFRFPVTQDKANAFGVQAAIDSIEHRAAQRDTMMRLDHGRRVRGEDRHRVPLPYPPIH